MPYYPTLAEDLARTKEILERGRVRPEDMPEAMREVAHVAGGTIFGVDTYAAYKLLESFVAEIERLTAEVDRMVEAKMVLGNNLERQLAEKEQVILAQVRNLGELRRELDARERIIEVYEAQLAKIEQPRAPTGG